jgi:hypothetical protein
MAIIHQSLFGWEEENDKLGDLKRLQIILETLPDEALMQKLEHNRKNGRDDYPVRAMWNLIIAGFVFGHKTTASLLRELNRNIQLVHVCGFGFSALPKAYNMSRFINTLIKHENEIKEMFIQQSEVLYEKLTGFGEDLAIDSKWIESAANQKSKRSSPDGRSETEARKGIKTYRGFKEDGTAWENIVSCFGFKLHVLVDATYELPVAYELTNAAASDIREGKKLLRELAASRPTVLETCRYFMGDKGYDDTELIELLKRKGIKAVIDKRTMWKDEKERIVPGYEDIYHDEAGNVYCYTKDKGTRRQMSPNGYEKERDALRFKCPSQVYGVTCPDEGECKCKSVRIPLATNPRIFTQVHRESHKWKRLYRKRTAVERFNSRLDGAYCFEERRTRGLARTKLQVGLAMLIMQAMAIWRIRNQQEVLLRSLIRAA